MDKGNGTPLALYCIRITRAIQAFRRATRLRQKLQGVLPQQGPQGQAQATLFTKTSLQLLWCEAAIATTSVIALAFLWWRSTETRRVRKIVHHDGSQTLPTPCPGLPRWLGFLGGHTLRIDLPKMSAQLENWAKELGGDYVLQAFGRRIIVVTSAADIRRILALRPSKFIRSIDRERHCWAGTETGVAPAMFFDEGRQWGRKRQLISPNLAGHNITDMIPYVAKIGERLSNKFGELADMDEVVDAKQYFARFAHDTFATVALGVDVDSINATEDRPCLSFRAMQSTLWAGYSLLFDAVKILQWKYLSNMVPWIRRVRDDARQLDDMLKTTVDAARSGKGEDAPTAASEDFAGTLLRNIISRPDAKARSDRMKLSDDEVRHEVKMLFIAGTDTTALTLSWVMYYLAKNPMAFARCRAEGLKAAPSSGGMVSTSEQLSQLNFCAAVFREVVRLKSAGPIIPNTSLGDHTMINGYKIKEGDAVIALNRLASISEENFTKGAEFVPERWIESERAEALLGTRFGDVEKDSIRHMDDAFLGFGSGPRVCPGKDMARVETTIIIAAICSRFDVFLAPGQADPPEYLMQFTTGPQTMYLKFKRNDPASQIESTK